MKTIVTISALLLMMTISLQANGVAITDAKNAIYLTLQYSDVQVHVENQVAVVTTTQAFKNELGKDRKVKFGFPMPEGASATELKYQVDNQWYLARFSPVPQDTSLPSPNGDVHPDLELYLGDTPLYYNFTETVRADSNLVVKLTYVQLLPYKLGKVDFSYPNDYRLIQTGFVLRMSLDFYLNSERTINDLKLIGLTEESRNLNSTDADIHFTSYEEAAAFDYHVQYELSLDELGLFSMSTALHDTLVPDEYGTGFFTFIAEPDPTETVIDKVFTLIIDRSGSMGGDKILQARNAAGFIVKHLNPGDMFNIVDFATNVASFRPSHIEFSDNNKQAAIDYISGMYASGGTNISGAFDLAIPQFSAASQTTANIIIFFTDGEATAGITDTDQILSHVGSLNNQNETGAMIFTFGIGSSTNVQLLTRLANENGGIAEFLGNDELEERITEFYLMIRNPVLLNTALSFSPDIISECYPTDPPNLYIGQQLIVSGRYNEPVPVTVTLQGNAFGKDIRYDYVMNLSDSTIDKNQFLTKLWAKQKIEHLLIQYYTLAENDPALEALHVAIVELSLDYGVMSPFTSFSGSDPTGFEENIPLADGQKTPQSFELLGNYPNPFNPSTIIQFQVNSNLHSTVYIRIYNNLGQLICTLLATVNGQGVYEVLWDGFLESGLPASSGTYLYVVDFGDGVVCGKMTLMR